MPDPAANPFAVLGISPGFDLDPMAIDRAYRARAARAHPDLEAPSPSSDSGDASIEALNRARAALVYPERRADARRVAMGGPAASVEKGLPDGFLMEIMQTRMEIEAAVGDDAEIARWEAWAEEERERYIERVSALFARLPVEEREQLAARTEVRRVLNAWRYIERLIEQLDPAYDPATADFGR
jgi:molecular chaperone HscB